MNLVPSCIFLLSIVTGISGEYGATAENSMETCPDSPVEAINDILAVARTMINDNWEKLAESFDPVQLSDNPINIPYKLKDAQAASLSLQCGGISVAESVDEITVIIPEIGGISMLEFDNITLEDDQSGKGSACANDPNSGPFRCAYAGGIEFGARVIGGLTAEGEFNMKINCAKKKLTWKGIKTTRFIKEYKKNAVCVIGKDVIDLTGNYCAGQCKQSPFLPMVSSILFDQVKFESGDIACDLGDGFLDNLLEIGINAVLPIVATKLGDEMITPVNEAMRKVFPFPSACAAKDKNVGGLRLKD